MGIFGSKDAIITTVSGDELTAIVREAGFAPELTVDSGGDPMIRFKVEGMKSLILFYGCTGGRATSLQFSGGFNTKRSLEQMNEWNRKKRFGKAYLDHEGDVMVTLDVDLDGGVKREYFEELLKRWRGVVLSFVDYLRETGN